MKQYVDLSVEEIDKIRQANKDSAYGMLIQQKKSGWSDEATVSYYNSQFGPGAWTLQQLKDHRQWMLEHVPAFKSAYEQATSNVSTVRAKFRCNSVEQSGTVARVQLTPVVNGSAENQSFYGATPGGSIDLQIVSPNAAAFFAAGRDVYVDFSRAD